MSRHVMSITYKPKVLAVREDECQQTIRRVGKKEIKCGDVITFHGWQGRPYRSKWSWRKEVVVKEVLNMWANFEIIWTKTLCLRWDSYECDILARRDLIDPPMGIELKDVLWSLNNHLDKNIYFQIIRW